MDPASRGGAKENGDFIVPAEGKELKKESEATGGHHARGPNFHAADRLSRRRPRQAPLRLLSGWLLQQSSCLWFPLQRIRHAGAPNQGEVPSM